MKRKPPKERQPSEEKCKKRRIEIVDYSSSSSSNISGIDCINSKLFSTNVSFENFEVHDECKILSSTAFQVQNDSPSKRDKDKCVNTNSVSEKAVLEDQDEEISSKNGKHDLNKIIPWIQKVFF